MMSDIKKILIGGLGRIIISLAVVCHLTPALYAAFEDTGAGARSAGMAGAYTAVADDANAIYYNPAGLGGLDKPEVASSLGKMFMNLYDKSDLGNTDLFVAYPFSKYTLGAGARTFSLDGYYTESEYSLAVGRLVRGVGLGLTLKSMGVEYGATKYTYNAIEDSDGQTHGNADPVFASGLSKSGFGADFGAMKKLNNFNLAFAAKNFISPDLGLKASIRPAMLLKLGCAYDGGNWLASLDAVKEDGYTTFRLGAEAEIRQLFSVRGGLEISGGLNSASLGVAYRMSMFSFNYAFVLPLGGVEGTIGSHWIGLDVKFGEVAEEKAAAEKVRKMVKKKKPAKMSAAEKERIAGMKANAVRELRRFYLYGVAAEKRGDFNGAQKYFQQELVYEVPVQLAGDADINGLLDQAKAKLEESRGKAAAGQKKTTESQDKAKKEHFSKATQYYSDGKYEEAIKEWEKVLEIDPNHKLSQMKIKKAREELKKQKAAQNEKLKKAYFMKGTGYYIKGDYAKAIGMWQKVLKIDPNHKMSQLKIKRAKEMMKSK